jgi:hypothetical protein
MLKRRLLVFGYNPLQNAGIFDVPKRDLSRASKHDVIIK